MQSSNNRPTGEGENLPDKAPEDRSSAPARSGTPSRLQFTIRKLLIGMAVWGGALKINEHFGDTQSTGSQIINKFLFSGDVQRSPELPPVDLGTLTLSDGKFCSVSTVFQDCGMDKNGPHYIPHTTFSITMPGANGVLVKCSVKQGKPPNQKILELTSHTAILQPPGCDTIDESALLSELRASLPAPEQPDSDPSDLARRFATVRPNDIRNIAKQPNREEVLLALLRHALDNPTPP